MYISGKLKPISKNHSIGGEMQTVIFLMVGALLVISILKISALFPTQTARLSPDRYLFSNPFLPFLPFLPGAFHLLLFLLFLEVQKLQLRL